MEESEILYVESTANVGISNGTVPTCFLEIKNPGTIKVLTKKQYKMFMEGLENKSIIIEPGTNHVENEPIGNSKPMKKLNVSIEEKLKQIEETLQEFVINFEKMNEDIDRLFNELKIYR